MSAPTWTPTAAYESHRTFDPNQNYFNDEISDEGFNSPLTAGDRIGSSYSHSYAKARLRRWFFMAIALCGSWALLRDEARRTWVMAAAADAYQYLGQIAATQAGHAAPASANANAAGRGEPQAKSEAVSAEDSAAQDADGSTQHLSSSAAQPETQTGAAATVPVTEAALPPAAKSIEETPAPPLPPAKADPADPYQVKALAVGLHPDLSKALLAKLSAADYKNAGVAIKTALAETADDDAYVWPRQKKADLALFQVHFVPGAAADCRRYVVTVSKDGWLTTALPMEKCGLKLDKKHSG